MSMLVISLITAVSLALPFETRPHFHTGDLVAQQRIVDGVPTTPSQFPYIVSLKYSNGNMTGGHFCGGSLIKAPSSENPIVLTAAHCLDSYEAAIDFYTDAYKNLTGKTKPTFNLYVDIGRTRIKTLEYQGEIQVFDRIEVSKFTMHPNYNTTTLENDIALMELAREVNTSLVPDVGEVAWDGTWGSPENLGPDDWLTVIGYGRNQSGGYISPTLEYVNKSYMNNSVANDYFNLYLAAWFNNFTVDWTNPNFSKITTEYDYVTDDMICAHAVSKDACQGDSGGPLVIPGDIEDGSDDIQVGIVSWGYGCASGPPGVYASVYYFRDWIQACLDYYDGDKDYKDTCGGYYDTSGSSNNNNKNNTEKILIAVFVVIGFLLIVIILVSCCCYCDKKRKSREYGRSDTYIQMQVEQV